MNHKKPFIHSVTEAGQICHINLDFWSQFLQGGFKIKLEVGVGYNIIVEKKPISI